MTTTRASSWLAWALPCRPLIITAHTVLPIAVGTLIYVLWRPSDLRVFGWLRWMHLSEAVLRARELAAPAAERLPDFLLYSLPNGLWAYALMASVGFVWPQPGARGRELWTCAVFGFAVLPELAQGLRLVPGVFDVVDLVACALGACAGRWLVRNRVRSNTFEEMAT